MIKKTDSEREERERGEGVEGGGGREEGRERGGNTRSILYTPTTQPYKFVPCTPIKLYKFVEWGVGK